MMWPCFFGGLFGFGLKAEKNSEKKRWMRKQKKHCLV